MVPLPARRPPSVLAHLDARRPRSGKFEITSQQQPGRHLRVDIRWHSSGSGGRAKNQSQRPDFDFLGLGERGQAAHRLMRSNARRGRWESSNSGRQRRPGGWPSPPYAPTCLESRILRAGSASHSFSERESALVPWELEAPDRPTGGVGLAHCARPNALSGALCALNQLGSRPVSSTRGATCECMPGCRMYASQLTRAEPGSTTASAAPACQQPNTTSGGGPARQLGAR